jgi:hypothetical protein
LIESGPRASFVTQPVKIFFTCEDVGVARDTEEKSMRARKIVSDHGAGREKIRVRKTLISSEFL